MSPGPARTAPPAASLRVRAVAGALVTVVGGALLAFWFARTYAAMPAVTLEDAVLRALCGAGAVLCLWLTLGTTLAALATAPGRLGSWCGRWSQRLAPTAVRRLTGILLGATVVSSALPAPGSAEVTHMPTRSGLAVTTSLVVSTGAPRAAGLAGAVTADAPRPDLHGTRSEPPAAPATGAAVPSPGWTPTQPPPVAPRPDLVTTGGRDLREAPGRGAASEPVVVRRGDTLWGVVGRALGPDADPLRIAAEVPRWHEHNHTVIGSDPNLIRPGQLLMPPGPPG